MPLTHPGLVLSQKLNSLPPVLPSRFPTPRYHHQQKYSVRELTQHHRNSCLDLSPPQSLNFLPLLSMWHLALAHALRSEKMSKLHRGSSLHSVKRMSVIKVRRKERQSTVRTPQWNIMLVGLWVTESTLHPEGTWCHKQALILVFFSEITSSSKIALILMSFLCEWQSNFVPLKRCPFLLELASQTSPVVKRRPLLINAIYARQWCL